MLCYAHSIIHKGGHSVDNTCDVQHALANFLKSCIGKSSRKTNCYFWRYL